MMLLLPVLELGTIAETPSSIRPPRAFYAEADRRLARFALDLPVFIVSFFPLTRVNFFGMRNPMSSWISSPPHTRRLFLANGIGVLSFGRLRALLFSPSGITSGILSLPSPSLPLTYRVQENIVFPLPRADSCRRKPVSHDFPISVTFYVFEEKLEIVPFYRVSRRLSPPPPSPPTESSSQFRSSLFSSLPPLLQISRHEMCLGPPTSPLLAALPRRMSNISCCTCPRSTPLSPASFRPQS